MSLLTKFLEKRAKDKHVEPTFEELKLKIKELEDKIVFLEQEKKEILEDIDQNFIAWYIEENKKEQDLQNEEKAEEVEGLTISQILEK